ncbi:MAG: vitamin B12 dependent methionine synthase [Candidatus Saccharibacteria bacterium]
MDVIIFDNITFTAGEKEFLDVLKLHPDSGMIEEAGRFFREAREFVRPKAVYMNTKVERAGSGFVVIGGVQFDSQVLRKNIEQSRAVFPFIATCGREIADWAASVGGMLESYWADTVMTMALETAANALYGHLLRLAGEAQLSRMNPGSLAAWPIEQQKPLMELLGEGATVIGVSLTEQYLLRPFKSVSGIQFVGEEYFVNCLLCTREDCPNRERSYNESLWGKYGGRD